MCARVLLFKKKSIGNVTPSAGLISYLKAKRRGSVTKYHGHRDRGYTVIFRRKTVVLRYTIYIIF